MTKGFFKPAAHSLTWDNTAIAMKQQMALLHIFMRISLTPEDTKLIWVKAGQIELIMICGQINLK